MLLSMSFLALCPLFLSIRGSSDLVALVVCQDTLVCSARLLLLFLEEGVPDWLKGIPYLIAWTVAISSVLEIAKHCCAHKPAIQGQ